MWDAVKILGGALLLLAFLAPIAALVIKVAERIGSLYHGWKLARIERDAAWVEMRRKAISWHGPDERGFLGVMFDADQGVFHDTDSGQRWRASDGSVNADPDQFRTAISQRLFSAMSGVKIEKKDAQAVAQGGTAKVRFEAETLLSEPAPKVERDDVQA